jgi:hypothetical protein
LRASTHAICRFCDGIGCSLCGGTNKKRSKFNVDNSPEGKARRTVNDIVFHSEDEAKRYSQLLLLERARHINKLELQPKYNIEINGIKITEYIGDFRYFDVIRGARVLEDVKGVMTDLFKVKRKLVEALYPGTKITIVKMRG